MKTLNRFLCSVVLLLVTGIVLAACGGNDSAPQAASWGGGVADEASVWNVADMRELDTFSVTQRRYGGDDFAFLAGDTTVTSAPSPAATPVPATEPAAPSAPASVERVRHIIQTAMLEMETEYFDDVIADLRDIAPSFDGFIESEMLSTHWRRTFTIVLRIPAPHFETALAQVEALADIRHMSQNAQDVTDRFYDLTGNLDTRLIEEERILALIEEAETIQDLLALEARLSNTRLAIETYRSQLETMADQIAFSTITVTLFDAHEEEIIAATVTLGERIGGAFGDSVDGVVSGGQNIIVFFAGAVIPLGLLGVFGFACYLVVKTIVTKRRFRQE
ncbi:MAG: DUF4349 domain-containing protein [Defluviitaleaceae bacterium]|nr:DUF4349 domain-containing protein [Defluviitaleaceae bacterium]